MEPVRYDQTIGDRGYSGNAVIAQHPHGRGSDSIAQRLDINTAEYLLLGLTVWSSQSSDTSWPTAATGLTAYVAERKTISSHPGGLPALLATGDPIPVQQWHYHCESTELGQAYDALTLVMLASQSIRIELWCPEIAEHGIATLNWKITNQLEFERRGSKWNRTQAGGLA
ncbi:hypothetical protein [Hoyosella altamirensis]|uniref:Uncharacterized protein n=2 Tax=Hoyosella altamirensis TaxID=616997 RepID=A0A839RW95_9ACTN|nr:hypothetical protein [Hoyosella altamirensis]MBB3040021.1 hypothetical protein [Hoyosella altamirensis]